MVKLYFFMSLFVIVSFGQNSNTMQAMVATDSLVDVFPLAIGNQWTYSYGWHYYDEIVSYTDTGTVSINIINRIVTLDTTRWFMQETSNLWIQYYGTGPFGGPINSIDTVELIELNRGNHRLYKIGDMNTITQSVFPFLPYVDTMVYRYSTVSNDSTKTVRSWNQMGKGYFTFGFKQGIGLNSVSLIDGCTCTNGFSGNHFLRSQIITGVAAHNDGLLSNNYHLLQNYPNPFNPSTTISFNLPLRSFVSLKVFDLIGREVAIIISESMQVGNYSRQWDASNLPSGIYFYRLQAGSFAETKKLILLR